MTLPRFAAVQWLLFVAVLGGILYLLSPILTPLVSAAILAYIFSPVVNRTVGCRLPRVLDLVMGGLLVRLHHADARYLDSTMYRAP